MATAQASSPYPRYAEGDCPSWKQLNYAVGLLCELAEVERPSGKVAMRKWIADLLELRESRGDDCPF